MGIQSSRALRAAVLLAGCRASPVAPERFVFESPAMGTTFRIVVYGSARGAAAEAATAAFARVGELERVFSDYDPSSELGRLEASSDAGALGAWHAASPLLVEVAAACQDLARESAGAFDVSVGALTRLWRQAARRGELPRPERVAEARALVGPGRFEVDRAGGRLRFLARGVRLDFGAIAKGRAVDEALDVLRSRGFARALVVGGGELRAGDAPPGAAAWTVALARLGDTGPAEALALRAGAVATSGDLERFVEIDGVRYGHVLDPRTGAPLAERRLATVLARDAETADALATAIDVLGAEEGLALARARGVEARVATLRGGEVELRSTAGFARSLSSRP